MQIDYYYNKIKSFSCINDAIYEFIQACFESHPEFTISRQIQWIHVHNKTSNAPAQGWKIHVSATYISAINVLREVSKVVLDEKLTSSCFLFLLNLIICFLLIFFRNENRHRRHRPFLRQSCLHRNRLRLRNYLRRSLQ